MIESLETHELDRIAQDNTYGFLVLKPDAVEKDLVEIILSHVLCSEPFANHSEVIDICIMGPITDPNDLRLLYPNLDGDIWQANRQLFASEWSIVALLKSDGFNICEELTRIKGKVNKDPDAHGLQEGIRGLIPTIGEKDNFINIRKKKESGETLNQKDLFSLVRNLAHTPDTPEAKYAILQLMKKYTDEKCCL